MSRIIELKWTCGECGTKGILGRHKRCPSCGSSREKGEMQMSGLNTDRNNDGYNDAASVTDPELLRLARAGADWFCSHCGSGNRGDGDQCSACGGPRYGEAEEDHPDFAGDHRGKAKREPWEDSLDMHQEHAREAMSVAKLRGPPGIPPSPPRPRRASPARPRPLYDDGVDDYLAAREKSRKQTVTIAVVAGAILVTCIVAFAIWATRTHEVQGTVTAMSWQHETVLQRWTQTTTGAWEDSTVERREVPPVNGKGERAGMEKVPGSCHEKHHHDEQYVCGSHRECTPRTRTETYDCGETCTDNGNGFATCTTKTCTREVPDGEDCRDVDDYCDRPIYETWCQYETQEWRQVRTADAAGRGKDTSWPTIEPGSLDRLRYRAEYAVVVSYRDRGEDETYTHEPGDTDTWLGKKLMTPGQAKAAEKAYLAWDVGSDAVLTVNNLGGVREVQQGRIQAEAVTFGE